MRNSMTADQEQTERATERLEHAYVLARKLSTMDAARINSFVINLLDAGEARHLDAMLEHLDVSSGAWRELADQAEEVIKRVSSAFERAVLLRSTRPTAGAA